jgi:hypothetical protein
VTARFWALSALVFFLGAQLSSLAHWTLVQHVTCPEHGEWVHVDAPDLSSVPVDVPAIRDLGPDIFSAEHEHDHCLATATHRPLSTAVTGSYWTRSEDSCSNHFATREQQRESRIPLYALAPKNSPPA